jgi:hypothetical protein
MPTKLKEVPLELAYFLDREKPMSQAERLDHIIVYEDAPSGNKIAVKGRIEQEGVIISKPEV